MKNLISMPAMCLTRYMTHEKSQIEDTLASVLLDDHGYGILCLYAGL